MAKLIDLIGSARRTLPQPVEVSSLEGVKLGLRVPTRSQEAEAQAATKAWVEKRGYDKAAATDDLRDAYETERCYRAAAEILALCLVDATTGQRIAENADELECLTPMEIDVLYGRLKELTIELSPKIHQLSPAEIKDLVDDLGKGGRPAALSDRWKNCGRFTLLALLDSMAARLVTSGGATSSTSTTS